MKKEELAMQVIEAAYRAGSSQHISEEEIASYIHSMDFLENILRFSKTAFLVVGFEPWTYLYCSNNTLEVLGHSPDEFLEHGPKFGLRRLHPEDLVLQGKVHPYMVNFHSDLPLAERNRYKFTFTSRLIHKDGREVQVLQNNFFLKWDDAGNPLIKLITFTDITPYKLNNDVIFYITHLPENGGSKVVHQQCLSRDADISLSARELEVLELVTRGASAREGADILGIELYTLKNHKKSIKKKLGCRNSAHMITLARLYGFLQPEQPNSPLNAN